MKLINKLAILAIYVLAASACQKVELLPVYKSGSAPVITTSTTTFTSLAADSLKPAITFSWTSPEYATDSSKVKYLIEIDSAGRNFSKAVSTVVTGSLSKTFLAKEFNSILLSFGFAFGVPYDVDVRLTSSYGNNNDRIVANTVKLKATPYKIPPKVALPSTGRLFITGNATDFDWTNPNPMPSIRELTRIEETKWAGIFHYKGTGGYLIVQQAGNWDDKYAVADNSVTGIANGGNFGFKLANDFSGNVKDGDGWYKIVLDFQSGTFSVTKVANALPSQLYTVGNATDGEWNNSPPAAQKFTQVTNGVFELTTSLKSGLLKFLSSPGNWQPQFAGKSSTSGDLDANYGGGNDPDNINISSAGSYKIQVNFITNKYTITKL